MKATVTIHTHVCTQVSLLKSLQPKTQYNVMFIITYLSYYQTVTYYEHIVAHNLYLCRTQTRLYLWCCTVYPGRGSRTARLYLLYRLPHEH